ncbi:MAG: diguanylate cyclase, partial [Chitinophagaceae bacterium]|nr:diguanylate cyclase [Rubrivivax sp.]
RSLLAARARYQAAALQTELLKLQHQLEDNEAKRRDTERARADLALANEALQRKVAEVQSLQAALREQATLDALTGLFNRRHLNDTLPAMQALALRDKRPLAAVVIDLDKFKAVNDTHGHPAGDCLLADFGRLLRAQLRRSDMAFRYGGEEFCLLLPNTTAAAARSKVEGLLATWRAQRFSFEGGTLDSQSFSAGVADTVGVPTAPAALLYAADNQLLAAKRAGRSRVQALMTLDGDTMTDSRPPASFAEFQADATAQGFDEVVVREWEPDQVLQTHSHTFQVKAWVVRGEFALTSGGNTRRLRAGDGFELEPGTPHAESYGSEGATFWVARRHVKASASTAPAAESATSPAP